MLTEIRAQRCQLHSPPRLLKLLESTRTTTVSSIKSDLIKLRADSSAVHETVQPVIHKETIAREVVHTTVPVHEKHIAPSEHHGISTLPAKTMSEFTKTTAGGSRSHEEYEGHPRPYNTGLMKDPAPVDLEPAKHDGMHDPEATGHFASRKTASDRNQF